LSKIIAQSHPTDKRKEPIFGMPRRCAVGDVEVETGPVLGSFMPPNLNPAMVTAAIVSINNAVAYRDLSFI
jgi:hypothetical protein